MQKLRICLGQINPTVGDLEGNFQKIIQYIKEAQKLEADIIAFPELSLCGYPPEDLLLKDHFIKENESYLKKIIQETNKILVILGFPYFERGKLFNAAGLIYNQELIGIYKKIFLPNYGVFDEMRYFFAGEETPVLSIAKKVRLGVNICEDIWHKDGPQKNQALLGGAKIIINLSSSPYYAQKIIFRQKLLSQRARETKAFIFYCNLAGGQDELVFDGGSLVFNPQGKLLARAKQFEEDLLVCDLNLNDLKKNLFDNLSQNQLKVFNLPLEINSKSFISKNKIEKKLKFIEEVYIALLLGIKDYARKNNFNKAVLGLSGGIDSSLTAVLAVKALGKDNVIGITMSSIYSSLGTRLDALKSAKNLGIKLLSIPINKIYQAYLSILKKPFLGTKLDATEENLQARIRGNILMAVSNKFGWLVLTTGNKSELSVGYCTLYGDMAGGLAVLKDIPKTLVYKLANYINLKENKEIIPESVILRPPSAELRENQKDQDTLPPYPILDKIISEYIEKDQSLEVIIKKGIKKEAAEKIILMIDRNEYKRRQSPPGIKITTKALGKDRRMPITNKFYR